MGPQASHFDHHIQEDNKPNDGEKFLLRIRIQREIHGRGMFEYECRYTTFLVQDANLQLFENRLVEFDRGTFLSHANIEHFYRNGKRH